VWLNPKKILVVEGKASIIDSLLTSNKVYGLLIMEQSPRPRTRSNTMEYKQKRNVGLRLYDVLTLRIHVSSNVIAEIELSDDKGNPKCLREHLHRYASDLLRDKEVYVLLQVDSKFIHHTMYMYMSIFCAELYCFTTCH